jgi:hypothetical protein
MGGTTTIAGSDGGSNTSANYLSPTEDAGYVTRMVENLAAPIIAPHSLTVWAGMLALGFIAVFVWTRILKYISE